ncbi:putative transporter [[Actinomadura] parvosata subsp. kistnae]|uniref:MFS transporter n=1 Tax=[Actinomadura] parvosata subsp. kistnae TaxID=1909395 RepID=A0A1V0A1F6_9ACTN|nr:MFS transporter [Nonomuraea sp. ATCC 55076]AQZ64041.1 MFS transporter [Nonomuraea sp. ATCC 55076]SPL89927.1 putative transporter [Actinomadura parvosata subsp. kistnae]
MPVSAPPAALDDSPGARRREQRGWYFYDWANSAFYTVVISVFLGPYLIPVAKTAACAKDFPTVASGTCLDTFDALVLRHPGLGYVDVLGADIRPAAYFGLITTIAVFLQILVLPVVGALADHTGRKKELLGGFAYVGALAAMCLFFVEGDRYLLGGVLFILANLAYGASVVVYDSFLPQISTPEERDGVSSRGWAIGYLGGGLLLALNLVLYLQHESLGLTQGMAVRICMASAALWWATFTIIPLLRLRNRPVPAHESTALRSVGGSFRQLGRTLAELRRYPLTLLFLIAYLVYNDGVQTVIGNSAAFASEALKLSQDVQITAILMVQFVAFFGALLLGRLARSFGTKRTVLASLVLWTAIVAMAMFVAEGQALQFYLMAFAIAIVLGGTQALSRSLFSLVIPRGREAEYFSLLQISDKGSAFIGSLTITLALQFTNSYRIAILSMVVFFVIGFVLLAVTNLPRAIRAAGNEVPGRI